MKKISSISSQWKHGEWCFTGIIFLILLLIFCQPAVAQTRIHRNLTPADGLVQSQVISLHEDTQGYLWIGTYGGLSRWDGLTFRNFSKADGLGHKEIQDIAETPDGTMVFATKGGGVTILKDGLFSVLDQTDGLAGNVSRSVAVLPGGDIVAGTDGGLCVIRDGQVIPPAADGGLRDILVVKVVATSDGRVFVATWGDGLLEVAGSPLKVVNRAANLPTDKIRALVCGSGDQVFFIPAGEGIFTLKNNRGQPLVKDPSFGGFDFISLHVRPDGTLLAGTENQGLLMIDGTSADHLDSGNGLASNSVYAFSEGRNGLLFFGTWGGVSIFNQDRVITVGTDNGLNQSIVSSISFSQSDSSIYFGFPDQGIQKYRSGKLSTLKGTGEDVLHMVWDVQETPDGSLLIGSDYGVHSYHDGILKEIPATDGAKLRAVQSLLGTADGGLTVMDMHGLYRWEDQSLEPLLAESEDRIQKATSILEISSGNYLLGTISGVFEVSGSYPAEVNPYQPLKDLESSTIWALHQLEDGRLLAGTNEKGLAVYTPGSTELKFLNTENGLSDNTVLAIVEDTDGVVYLSTNRGVNILSPAGPDWKISHLGFRDGLGSSECVQGALAISPEGYLWIGTIGGASRFDRKFGTGQATGPLLKIDKFSIFDREIPQKDFAANPSFSHRENYLKIEFTGIHLVNPEQVSYRYRLSSVDQGWVQSQRQYVQYTKLTPGHYQFEISANLPSGLSSPMQVWEFTITPPFWRTWWFILLSVLVVGGAVGLLILFRVRQLLALERLRTRIAADLHDDIGSGLTEISIVSSLIPRKLSEENGKLIEPDLHRIGATVQHLIAGMSDIVWLVNPQLDSLFDLLAKLGESNSEMLAESEIRFEDVNLDSLKKVKLRMETRRQLLLIFKEAISNAIKYSGADHIRLEASFGRRSLKIILTDNGKGFDQDNYQPEGSGNGIRNMKLRAESIGGGLNVESRQGQGTRIVFEGAAG